MLNFYNKIIRIEHGNYIDVASTSNISTFEKLLTATTCNNILINLRI